MEVNPSLSYKELPWLFRIRAIEVDQRLLELHEYNLEGDEDFIIDLLDKTVSTEEELFKILSANMPDPDALVLPYCCNCPI